MKSSKSKYTPIAEEPRWFGYGYLYPFTDSQGKRVWMCLADFRSIGLSHPYELPNQ